jgi:Spy/CpxP family protein refolding chaperone
MMTFADNDDFDLDSGGVSTDLRLPIVRANRAQAWMLAALGIVIFVLGLVCGVAAMRLIPETKPPMSWNDLLDRVAKRMQHDLDLTEAQQARIGQVVRAHQPELNRIRARTVSEMRAELRQVIEEMSVVLTPEQARRFRAEAQPRLDLHFPADGEQTQAKSASD